MVVEDFAIVSVLVGIPAASNGVSFQAVSRKKTRFSFVLSGAKCSWKIFRCPSNASISGGYRYWFLSCKRRMMSLQSVTSEFASLLKHVKYK